MSEFGEKQRNGCVKGEEHRGLRFLLLLGKGEPSIQLYYFVIHLIRINNHRAVFERIGIRLKSENNHEIRSLSCRTDVQNEYRT